MMHRKEVAIIGFGLEGQALFNFLKKSGGHNFTILDRKRDLKIPNGAAAVLGPAYLKNLERFDIIFRSPGVPYNSPEFSGLKNKLSSLSKLFFELKKGAVIGITGSAGKTTAATLLYKILRNAGKDAYLCGNIGINALSILNRLKKNSITVMELSSFQLQDLKKSPEVAILLDIYEEHLNMHKNFAEYLNAKANIALYQHNSDTLIYAADNKYSKKIARLSRAKKLGYSISHPSSIFTKNGWIIYKNKKVIPLFEIKLVGKHDQKNIMAATLAAISCAVKPTIIRNTVTQFRGLPHRIEFVKNIKGVKYYDDSKATNVKSAIAGIDAINGRKIVLAGGLNKNLDMTPLAKRLLENDVSYAVLFGKSKNEIAKKLKQLGANKYKTAVDLKSAILIAHKKAIPGDAVLLAPATASFDQFKSYEERGDIFKKLVRRL